MPRQPWWPENPQPQVYTAYKANYGTYVAERIIEDALEAMAAAWRGRIKKLYEGPCPDFGYDRMGLLDWFVAQLLKEEDDE